MLKGENKEDEATDASASVDKRAPDVEEDKSGPKTQQNVAEIGGSKKRKQGKVVLSDKSEDAELNPTETQKVPKTEKTQKLSGKKKTKVKKVKLSFDEE